MKILVLVGPTGVGKSAVALEFARENRFPIINCDSVQLYQELVIGSARPTAEEIQIVPHHLFGEFSIESRVTAAQYARAAKERIAEIAKSAPDWCLIVGGTGFYLQALEKGMPEMPAADPEVQQDFWRQLKSPGADLLLHERLRQDDPGAADQIAPQDHYRLVRALEVFHSTGKSLSEWQEDHRKKGPQLGYPVYRMGLRCSRDLLKKRLERRAHGMLQEGFVGEVRGLMQRLPENHWVFQTVGYREVYSDLQSGASASLNALAAAIVQSHMQLAKKQMTWFRHRGEVDWIDLPEEHEEFEVEPVLKKLRQGLTDPR